MAARTTVAGPDADSRPLGPIQLQAKHNVRIDGHSAERGAFVAQADRASYEREKDVFLLEGDLRAPATIWYSGQSGSPPAFKRITFSRSRQHVEVDGLLYMEFSSGDLESARRASGAVRQ
jgi:hypothetical protein